jgi:predicted DNA-binding helix-hairpin-helix protein
VEIMTATRAQLLRLPGIGTTAADSILQARHRGRITDLSHLRRLNIRTPEKAAPYILLDGHRPLTQQALF